MYKYERKKSRNLIEPYTANYSQIYGDSKIVPRSKVCKGLTYFRECKKNLEKPAERRFKKYSAANSDMPLITPKTNLKKSLLLQLLSKVFRLCVVFIILISAVIGFSFAVNMIEDDQIRNLRSYDNIVWPVVMQDPAPFDENNPPANDMMASASIWDAAMIKKNNLDAFEQDQKLLLQLSEIQNSSIKLFGKEIDFNKLECKNTDLYEFKEDEKKFLVNSISGSGGFVPYTINCRRCGEDIELYVGYVTPKNQFTSDMKNIIPDKIEKCSRYYLKHNPSNGDLYISAVKFV